MKTPTFVLTAILFISSCQSSTGDHPPPGKDTVLVDLSHPQLPPPKRNPEFRAHLKKDAVAEFREPTGLPEGDFVVKLYQTSKTMAFRVEMEYGGLPGTDTVKLPDLGTEPHPVLQGGGANYSCIIGFLDNDKQFRELKLVRAKGDQLKVTSLRHWVVTDHYRLVSQ
ncbi:MAG TPA: hypothetical protein VG101_14100 [Puia sp.]|jgi:hypothetical protein|nr:hypothetical protein [Puia sp.]